MVPVTVPLPRVVRVVTAVFPVSIVCCWLGSALGLGGCAMVSFADVLGTQRCVSGSNCNLSQSVPPWRLVGAGLCLSALGLALSVVATLSVLLAESAFFAESVFFASASFLVWSLDLSPSASVPALTALANAFNACVQAVKPVFTSLIDVFTPSMTSVAALTPVA